ncbi:hypothetical protein F5Y19DRAFT_457969 [Xylariaceae sp. FL1651]|nr:hypothetical protein F5Y19DRAFT_457969 [Xylariaceae sp. FL1651]
MALDTPSFRVAMMIKQTKHRIARLEGTSYAMVSETEVNSGFCCHTGTSSAAGLASLNIGWNDVIPRWKTGSILTFNGDRGSFLCDQDYQVACNALTQAAKRWNGEISRHVTLKPVEEHEPAVFQLVYRQDRVGGNGKTYATAFSPDTPPQCRKLFVYAKSFESDNVDFMTNIFYHEIGHILGLRHEFADVDTEERRTKSVPFGPKNELSVMNYFPHPRLIDIQPRDAEWVRKFYDYKHESYLELRVVDVPVEELGVTRQDVALLCY